MLNRMLYIFVTGLLLSSVAVARVNSSDFTMQFTQEIVSVDSNGNEYPSVTIEPGKISGMQNHRFSLGTNNTLLIKSNIPDIEKRGLLQIVQILNDAYQFIDDSTGRQPKGGILLYLIEMDKLPLSYNFSAGYTAEANWSEVRLALIPKGGALLGPTASSNLAELLFDTIPHELGHDVLAEITSLPHDLDSGPSYHTRWFIEGICEVIAKEFARQQGFYARHRFLNYRNVKSVLSSKQIQDELFHWAQNNNNQMSIESDLYGAAMLTVMQWTKSTGLKQLLDEIEQSPIPLNGQALQSLMEMTTGKSSQQNLALANAWGKKLSVDDTLAIYSEQ